MTLEAASTGLGQNMALNPAASMSPFAGLPLLPALPIPAVQRFWEQPPGAFMPAPCSQGSAQLPPAHPRTPLEAGAGGNGPGGPGPFNLIFQVGTEGRPAGPPNTQNAVLTQAPASWSALRGAAGHPAPILMAIPAPVTIVPASASAEPQPPAGSWPLGLAPQGPPPLATLAPVASPMTGGPWQCRAGGEGSLASSQDGASTDGSCRQHSVYENFRHWQRLKTLVRRNLPGTPDVKALSCFLIPVLRTLSRREPTMSLEDGLWRGLQEWQRTSNFDKMIFHEMAEKFTEFEAAEEMENPKLLLMGEFQGRPPAAPPRLDPPKPSAPKVAQQPVCASRKTGPKSRAARPSAPKRQLPARTKAPQEIPPEAVQEYIDIMEHLAVTCSSASGASDTAREGDEMQPLPEGYSASSNPNIMSYIDKLCAQRDFVTRVEAIIHPQFLADLLSSEADMDILALTKVLEEEEGLTSDQLVEKRLQSSKKKGGARGQWSRAVPAMDSRDSKPAACRGAEQDGRGAQGVSTEACPPRITSQELPRCRATDAELPKRAATGSLSDARPHTEESTATCVSLRPRGPVSPSRASSMAGPSGTAVGLREDDELPSLAFLLASQHRLLPLELSHSQGPAMDLLCPGGRASQQGRGLHPTLHPATHSNMQALMGGASWLAKAPCSGPSLDGSGWPDEALGLARGSQPQKKCESSGPPKRKKKKRH